MKTLAWALLVILSFCVFNCTRRNSSQSKPAAPVLPVAYTLVLEQEDAQARSVEATAVYDVTEVSDQKIVLTCREWIGGMILGHEFKSVIGFNPQSLVGSLRVDDPDARESLKTGDILLASNGQKGYDFMITYHNDNSISKGRLVPVY